MLLLSTPHTIAELTVYQNISFDDLFAGTLPELAEAREGYKVFITKQYGGFDQLPDRAKALMQQKSYEFVNRFYHILDHYSDKDMHEFYTTFQIPKATGGYRTIKAPTTELKAHMRVMLGFFQQFLYPHQAAYAYVQSRCTRELLEAHQKKGYTWFLKMDMHDFFGSCSPNFILEQLLKLPFFSLLSGDVLAKFIHFITLDGGLPQGTPLSPYITNLLMLPIDNYLQKAIHAHHGFYTRYADDMIISTTSRQAAVHCSRTITEALPAPLSINARKTRIASINGKNWNLGLMYNKDKNITVGYRNKERFRAALNEFCLTHTTYSRQAAMELLGKLQYYKNIEPAYFDTVLTRYAQKYNIDIRNRLIEIITPAQ